MDRSFSEYFPVQAARGQVGGDGVILMVGRISICPGSDNIRVIVPVICFHFPHNITTLLSAVCPGLDPVIQSLLSSL